MSPPDAPVKIFALATNEELVVARRAYRQLVSLGLAAAAAL